MFRILFSAIVLLLFTAAAAQAAENVPGSSCAGYTANSWQWAGGPENGGVTNGMFCQGGTNLWTGIINFQSSGNIGIGTTNPGAALEVDSSLTNSSGTGYGLKIIPTISQSGTASYNGLLVNVTEFSVGSGLKRPLAVQLAGANIFIVDDSGNFTGAGATLTSISQKNSNTVLGISGSNPATSGGNVFSFTNSSVTTSSGTANYLSITPTYVESGTASDVDILINRTQTSLGSGTHNFIAGQVASVNKFTVSNTGQGYFASNVGIGTTSPGALLDIGNAGTTLGTMRLEGNTSGYVQLQTAAAAGSWTMTLPASAGTSGYVLSTNGSGVTSWVSAGGGAIGSDTQIAFNNSGTETGSANLTWNGTTLNVTGDMNYSGLLKDLSDRRLKEDIQPLPPGQLEKIMRLEPVSFVMKKDRQHRTEMGLVAQDVEPLYPDLVETGPDGIKSMAYVGLMAPLIKAMQEQQAEIDRLEAQNRALAARLDATGQAVRYHCNQ